MTQTKRSAGSGVGRRLVRLWPAAVAVLFLGAGASFAALGLQRILALVAPAAAITWYVDDNGSDSNNGRSESTPFRTIAKAESSASNGDTIILLEGTHLVSSQVSVDRSVTIQGNNGDTVIVRDTGSGNTFQLSSTTTIHIKDLIFENNNNGISSVFSIGRNFTNVSFSGCVFRNNNKAISSSSPLLIDNVVFDNQATLAVQLNGNAAGGFEIRNSEFRDCGTAINILNNVDYGASLLVEDCVFTNNAVNISNNDNISPDCDGNYWGTYNPDEIENGFEGSFGAAVIWKPFKDETLTYTFNPGTGPTDVYTNAAFTENGTGMNTGDPDGVIDADPDGGTSGLYWEWNAFNTIADAVARVKAGP